MLVKKGKKTVKVRKVPFFTKTIDITSMTYSTSKNCIV